MPRQARVSVADVVYHVINRAIGRVPIFHIDKDYQHFESLLLEARKLTDMRILAYCIMPNQFYCPCPHLLKSIEKLALNYK